MSSERKTIFNKRLGEFLKLLDAEFDESVKSLPVIDLVSDSRQVTPGALFVCTSTNPDKYVNEALDKGAIAILLLKESLTNFCNNYRIIGVQNLRMKKAVLAKEFFNRYPDNIVAVTGTNGKSSVVNLCKQFWDILDIKGASIGTLGVDASPYKIKDLDKLPQLTSLDSVDFYKVLSILKLNNVEHTAFEASSHGIDQFRCHGVNIKGAAFTNLSQDHLDYHQTMDEYFDVKTKLFTQILKNSNKADGTKGLAVINLDCEYSVKILKLYDNCITYSVQDNKADIFASNIRMHDNYMEFDLLVFQKQYKNIKFNLVGLFQIENLIAAIGLMKSLEIDMEKIIKSIPMIKPIDGRMQYAGKTTNGASVYIDYAHTPDSLRKALNSLRPHVKNNLWVVFGCGGNRDVLKRPLMGFAALEAADKIVITDDNPRDEEPAEIRKEILKGCLNHAKEIGDRKEAIQYAINSLKSGDCLLIAGKGHEKVQIIKNYSTPFDDVRIAKSFIFNDPKLLEQEEENKSEQEQKNFKKSNRIKVNQVPDDDVELF